MTVAPNTITAKQEGRYDDALRHLVTVFNQNCEDDSLAQARNFITMFEWSQLAECYPPAHQALATARDEQVRLLVNGDAMFNTSGEAITREVASRSMALDGREAQRTGRTTAKPL